MLDYIIKFCYSKHPYAGRIVDAMAAGIQGKRDQRARWMVAGRKKFFDNFESTP